VAGIWVHASALISNYFLPQRPLAEISSVSNFETFQANRLKLRFKDKDGKPTSAYLKRKFIGFAKSVSWNLENYQTAEGIVIQVLRPCTGLIL
jgi:seryl-tRNA synthetase